LIYAASLFETELYDSAAPILFLLEFVAIRSFMAFSAAIYFYFWSIAC